jgi:hypothetical protein
MISTILLLIGGYMIKTIEPFAKERFLQVVKQFNEYLKNKINKM